MKRKITFAVIAMAVSLSGIIVLQLSWISGAIKVRSKQFDGQVFDAMNDVADKLQVHESMLILQKKLPEMDSLDRRTIDSFYTKRLAYGKQYRGKFGRLHKTEKHINDDPFRKDKNLNDSPYFHNKQQMGKIGEEEDRWQKAGIRDSNYADSAKLLISKANRYNRMLKKMILNYIKENKDIHKRMDRALIDSFLNHELRQRGIELPYAAAIYNRQTGAVDFELPGTDTIAIKSTLYLVKLFPDDLVPQDWYLAVDFPGKTRFVLSSIGWILPGTFAFMLIIIISCGFTVFMLIRQKRLSEMKNDFINNMTHEFKTPIATISLATDAIIDPRVMDNKEKLKHYTKIIKEENNRMDLQVQKVLNAALMEKEDFKMVFSVFDAHEVIGTLIDRFMIQISERNGTLTWDGNAENHLIFGDEVHFGNVINNLLDNANKYSPEAPDIKVNTYNKNGSLIIEVEDKGIGMTRDTQKRIFDKFFRMSTGNLHDTKGFGLGLNYVKAVVLAHKGTIEVKSEIKKGSIFKIKLPLYTN
jgi:two-component system, OmpR family, phosphate regulon sensor histidine kinase PhoR